MERLRCHEKAFPPACFTCPARVYAEGEYYCDPGKLDDRALFLNVARYRSSGCPRKDEALETQIPPEIILRRVLRK